MQDNQTEISTFSRMKTIDHHNNDGETEFITYLQEVMDQNIVDESTNTVINTEEEFKRKRAGMAMTKREISEMRAFIEFLCDSSPIYLKPVLTNTKYVFDVEYQRGDMNPIVAQYIFDLYKLLFEDEIMSGYKVWAIEQHGEHKYGYKFHNTINEIVYLYIKYMRLMTPNCPKLNIITDKMKVRYQEYYGFSPVKE